MTYSLKFKTPESSILSKTALYAHLFKDLHIESIIYLWKFCDYRFTDIPDKKRIHFVKGNHLVLSGRINQTYG